MIKRVSSWIHPADGVEGSHLNALQPELSGWTGQAWGLQLWKHPACLHPIHWVTPPKRTQGLRARRGRAAAHCGLHMQPALSTYLQKEVVIHRKSTGIAGLCLSAIVPLSWTCLSSWVACDMWLCFCLYFVSCDILYGFKGCVIVYYSKMNVTVKAR